MDDLRSATTSNSAKTIPASASKKLQELSPNPVHLAAVSFPLFLNAALRKRRFRRAERKFRGPWASNLRKESKRERLNSQANRSAPSHSRYLKNQK